MRRSLLVWIMVAITAGCGASNKPRPQTRMSPREIMDASSPAIVRIQAGEGKVGTGFILDSNGLIATNLHVIAGEPKVIVTLYKDPSEYPATVVAAVDKVHDLALIRIKPKKALPVLKLGDSNVVSAGDRIYAIGNPLGVFDHSITDGLISQVRPVSDEFTVLQISAAISPGSSGGPLFNQFGEVIGVTTAIITAGQAINLAVPSNYLRPLMQRPISLPLDEFANATKEEVPTSDDAEINVQIQRRIPAHPLSLWAGCSESDMEDVLRSVGDAIAIGAPLYNRGASASGKGDGAGTRAGFEACFRVYEGTAIKFEQTAPCPGVRSAFGDGLLRAQSMGTFKEKAWALRDTFDGLIESFKRWCEQDSNCMKKFGPPPAGSQGRSPFQPPPPAPSKK